MKTLKNKFIAILICITIISYTFSVLGAPPYQPSNPFPLNNAINISTNVDLNWTGGDPDISDTVYYNVSFGIDPNPPIIAIMILNTNYDPGILNYDTQYYWRIEALDNHGNSTTGPLWTFRTEVLINDPPLKPNAPDGPPLGSYLKSHTYTSITTDPDNDYVYYRFDWDDGTISNWIGPYESGQTVSASHTWSVQGSYAIKVQAKDEHDAESIWSDPYSINIPKNKLFHHFLSLYEIFEHHPRLFLLLRQILEEFNINYKETKRNN